MLENDYICLNGDFVMRNSGVIPLENRSFRFGDGLFETIHANGVNLHFFDDHFDRLTNGLKRLKMVVPITFTKEKIQKDIEKLLNKNKYFAGNRIRLTIYRNSESKGYQPLESAIGYAIESFRISSSEYILNTKGLLVDLFSDLCKQQNYLSDLKSANALLYVMAAIYKSEQQFDDCFILNEKKNIVETISSNIFIVIDKTIITPPIIDGCVNGVMRKQIITLAKKINYNVLEHSITINDLLKADEMFITNAIIGINWIVAFKDKRYFNKVSKELIRELNALVSNG